MAGHVTGEHSRRELFRLGAAGGAGLCLGSLPAAAAKTEGVRRIPVGLQLYSVRGECGKEKGRNLKAVVEAVAKMGYQAVEFAGYYGWSAKDLRKLLDDNALTCCGTHTGLGALQGDNFKRTVEFHKVIGCKFIIVPSMPGKYRKDVASWKAAAKAFNELAEKLAAFGMRTGYHNHSFEFRPLGEGKATAWDVFFGGTGKQVVMQLDTGNCMGGGGDPVAILKAYPGRATTMHMKEHGGTATTVVGEGRCPWKPIIQLARTVAGTEWFIIEHERRGQPPLEAVAKCIDNFRKLQAEA